MKKIHIEGLEELSREQMKEIEGGCSVSCGSAFYACCNTDSCKCVSVLELEPADGGSTTCASGGTGSTSCST